MFSPIDGWLREHLYAVVFLGAVVDAVGIPFPGRIMLITVGSFANPVSGTGASTWAVIGFATLGTVVGDHAWYFIGRLKGRRLFELYSRLFRLSNSRMGAADRFLRRFGGLALVFARMAATLRVVVAPLAISRGMSYVRFLAFDFLGALLWAAGFVWLGRTAGTLASGSGLVGTLAVGGVLGTASAVISVLARRHFFSRVSLS
jgi:membrane protein DedA with SNARE-associated domain